MVRDVIQRLHSLSENTMNIKQWGSLTVENISSLKQESEVATKLVYLSRRGCDPKNENLDLTWAQVKD